MGGKIKLLFILLIIQSYIYPVDWKEELYKKYSPAVVTVICYDSYGKQLNHGSGFNVDESGKIVTNHHVVSNKNIAKVEIKFPNNDTYDVLGVLYEKEDSYVSRKNMK